MKFTLISLHFVRPAVVLVDDNPRTKDFDKKPLVLLAVGKKEIRDFSHICGFVSRIGNKAIISSSKINEIRKEYDSLVSMDIDSKLARIKVILGQPDLKIKEDFIVDRTLGDGVGPIQMFSKSRELWSK